MFFPISWISMFTRNKV